MCLPVNGNTSRCVRVAILMAGSLVPGRASASFLSGEALDTMADIVALVVLFIVPIGVLVLFWLVHILPEVIAEKRHHPQKDAIKTLCLLSLVFGGMLWPLAWLWAYSRPVAFRMAYGTEKHEDYYVEMAHKAKAGELMRGEIIHLREELDAIAAKGMLPPQLKGLRDELDALRARDTGPGSQEGGR